MIVPFTIHDRVLYEDRIGKESWSVETWSNVNSIKWSNITPAKHIDQKYSFGLTVFIANIELTGFGLLIFIFRSSQNKIRFQSVLSDKMGAWDTFTENVKNAWSWLLALRGEKMAVVLVSIFGTGIHGRRRARLIIYRPLIPGEFYGWSPNV